MDIKTITASDELWNDVRNYAEACSWNAGKALADRMDDDAFTDWERIIVALDNEKICGYCTVSKTDCIPDISYTPYIGFLFVDELYRGKRLSQQLIQHAMDYLKTVGFEKVYLVSDHINLYEKYGFSVIDRKIAPWGSEEKIYVQDLDWIQDNMEKYLIRNIDTNDYNQVVEIYNSNRQFLVNHLGVECIDEAFVLEEVKTMREVGFSSCVIVDRETQEAQGVLDYKYGKEVYLSLLMLKSELQGKGIGRDIYSYFETKMRQRESDSIRIDVVNDYHNNVVPFWKRLGFLECENVTLDWGNKRSKAVVMRKNIQS